MSKPSRVSLSSKGAANITGKMAIPMYRSRSAKSIVIEKDLIEKMGGGPFYPFDVPKTSNKPQINIFPYWRPKKGSCIDYNLEQDHIGFAFKKAQLFVRRTEANYNWNPNPPVPKQKKFKFGNGIKPPDLFVDEKWRQKKEEEQQMYKENLKERLREKKKSDKKRKKIFGYLYRNLTNEDYHYFKSSIPKKKCSCSPSFCPC